MERTEYSTLSTEELITYALSKDNRTHMEIELAQRLEVLLGMVEDMIEDDEDMFNGHDS